VDIVSPGAALDEYRLVVVPMRVMPDEAAVAVLARTQAVTVFRQRTGSNTIHKGARVPTDQNMVECRISSF
jgi:hypothetical protein